MTTSETKTEAKAEFEVAVMMAYYYSRRDRPGDWERSFVDDMHGKTRRPTLSLKQKSKLQDIYQRLGRK